MKSYYLSINGETKGPYATSQIFSMWNLGAIDTNTLYFNEKLNTWEKITALISSIESKQKAQEISENHNLYKQISKGTVRGLLLFSLIVISISFIFFRIYSVRQNEEQNRIRREQIETENKREAETRKIQSDRLRIKHDFDSINNFYEDVISASLYLNKIGKPKSYWLNYYETWNNNYLNAKKCYLDAWSERLKTENDPEIIEISKKINSEIFYLDTFNIRDAGD